MDNKLLTEQQEDQNKKGEIFRKEARFMIDAQVQQDSYFTYTCLCCIKCCKSNPSPFSLIKNFSKFEMIFALIRIIWMFLTVLICDGIVVMYREDKEDMGETLDPNFKVIPPFFAKLRYSLSILSFLTGFLTFYFCQISDQKKMKFGLKSCAVSFSLINFLEVLISLGTILSGSALIFAAMPYYDYAGKKHSGQMRRTANDLTNAAVFVISLALPVLFLGLNQLINLCKFSKACRVIGNIGERSDEEIHLNDQ